MTPFVIKRSFNKPAEKSSIKVPTELSSTDSVDYFKPKPVWSEPEPENYRAFSGTSQTGIIVANTGECNLYTYGSPLIAERSGADSNTKVNPLNQSVYIKPNIENAFEDFVNGASHLIGKRKDAEVNCVDADQVYVQHASKMCQTTNTQNKCFNSFGFTLQNGETFSYNKACNRTPCIGTVGSLSLNFGVFEDTILGSTRCITIESISVNEGTLNNYYLDFYQEIGIINIDSSVNINGPYPIKFSFDICNTRDPRQILKYVNYTYSVKSSSFVPSPSGTYGAIIFRGLDSYLDTDGDGNFILRQIENVEDTIKWIFSPEISLTRNSIPSTQRCSLLTSNMSNRQGQIEAELVDTRKSIVLNNHARGLTNLIISIIGIKNYKILGALANKKVKVDNQLQQNPEFTGQGDGDPVDPEDLGPDEVTADDLDEVTSATVNTVDIAGESALAASLDTLSSVLSYLGPIGMIANLWLILAIALPDPSYLDPPFLSLETPQGAGVTVIPTNYTPSANIHGPPGIGAVGTLADFNQYCIPWNFPEYPPYFLEALENGTTIQNEFINYSYRLGPAVTAAEALTFGARGTSGLFIWNNPNNLTGIKINSVWNDGETTWLVNDVFSDALGFPEDYFTGDLDSIVSINQGTPTASVPYYTPSRLNVITQNGICFTQSQINQNNVPGRIAGPYLNVPVKSTTGSGTSALFNVLVDVQNGVSSSPPTYVDTVAVGNGGSNYQIGDVITLSGTSVGGNSSDTDVVFNVSNTETERFIFKSLNKNNDQKFYYPEDDVQNIIQGNFETVGEIVQNSPSSAYILKISLDSKGNPIIANGGFNYSVNDTIYLAQYNFSGQRLTNSGDTGPISDLSSFITLTVSQINQKGYGYGQIAPEKLASSDSFYINYNFMENAGNFYAPSPQQIVYGGISVPKFGVCGTSTTLIKDLAETVGGNITSKNFYEYFLAETSEGVINTAENGSIVNLKSIQINNLKYTTNTEPTEITSGSSVVLGRFIPYQYFAPATRAVKLETLNVVTQTLDTSTDKVGDLYYGASIFYYNSNYAQIIPYGVENIYDNAAFSKNPSPKF